LTGTVPVVEAQTVSVADRDRALERLRTLTIAGFLGAAALTLAFSLAAAAGNPGTNNNPGSATSSAGDDGFQNQRHHRSNEIIGPNAGGRPVAVSGGS
jgi:hypothetical protein